MTNVSAAWAEKLEEIKASPKQDFATRFRCAGLKPVSHAKYADWDGADMSGANLWSFNFQGARMSRVRLANALILGAKFYNVIVGDIIPGQPLDPHRIDFTMASDYEAARESHRYLENSLGRSVAPPTSPRGVVFCDHPFVPPMVTIDFPSPVDGRRAIAISVEPITTTQVLSDARIEEVWRRPFASQFIDQASRRYDPDVVAATLTALCGNYLGSGDFSVQELFGQRYFGLSLERGLSSSVAVEPTSEVLTIDLLARGQRELWREARSTFSTIEKRDRSMRRQDASGLFFPDGAQKLLQYVSVKERVQDAVTQLLSGRRYAFPLVQLMRLGKTFFTMEIHKPKYFLPGLHLARWVDD